MNVRVDLTLANLIFNNRTEEPGIGRVHCQHIESLCLLRVLYLCTDGSSRPSCRLAGISHAEPQIARNINVYVYKHIKCESGLKGCSYPVKSCEGHFLEKSRCPTIAVPVGLVFAYTFVKDAVLPVSQTIATVKPISLIQSALALSVNRYRVMSQYELFLCLIPSAHWVHNRQQTTPPQAPAYISTYNNFLPSLTELNPSTAK